MQGQQTTLATEISIVKVDTCPSLSGRSQLSYQIGKGTSGDIHFRITQNTGSGQFNADWISLDDIEAIISTIPPERALSSTALLPLYRGKSSNSPAFLFAALKAETLVISQDDKDKGYLSGDIKAFRQSAISMNIQQASPPDQDQATCHKATPRKTKRAN